MIRLLDRRSRDRRPDRYGGSLVEFAIILPVFGILMMGILEFGHIYLVYNTMTAAAKRAARYGAVSGVTNNEVEGRASQILDSVIDMNDANVIVKDANIFDTPAVDTTTIQYNDLDDINVEDLESRQLFMIHITVPYNDVAIIPPLWAKNLVLTAQSVMRHE